MAEEKKKRGRPKKKQVEPNAENQYNDKGYYVVDEKDVKAMEKQNGDMCKIMMKALKKAEKDDDIQFIGAFISKKSRHKVGKHSAINCEVMARVDPSMTSAFIEVLDSIKTEMIQKSVKALFDMDKKKDKDKIKGIEQFSSMMEKLMGGM